MIALDAHQRARNNDQHQHQTFIAQVPVSEILSSYYDLCQQQLGHVTDVQQEVVVETTSTDNDSAQQQPVSCWAHFLKVLRKNLGSILILGTAHMRHDVVFMNVSDWLT